MKIHLIGIGGIGVSALAQYYLTKGHQVSGSDLVSSEITEALQEVGISVSIKNSPMNISESMDLVVYSPAVPATNGERVKAEALGIKTISYPEALGEMSKDFFTIAVSGSHGKSTTTAMIALLLVKAGIDPTVIVGTKLKEFGNNNFRMGKSKFLVIEACEYDGSFLHYNPNIAVVTNVDKEHLDYFKTFTGVVKTFKDFIARIPEGGFLVSNSDDAGNKKLNASKIVSQIRPYSVKQVEAQKIKQVLKVPGIHNVSNALASLAVARILGVKDTISFKALSEFTGTWRRFEVRKVKIKKKNITLVSDYGHHPNEVLVTLKAAREKFPKQKIWLLFEPHQYQRTFYLFNDFVKVFKSVKIDSIIIADIYDVAGRETVATHAKVSSQKLVEKIHKKNVQYMPLSEAKDYIVDTIKTGEVLLVMGAGSIYKVAEEL